MGKLVCAAYFLDVLAIAGLVLWSDIKREAPRIRAILKSLI